MITDTDIQVAVGQGKSPSYQELVHGRVLIV